MRVVTRRVGDPVQLLAGERAVRLLVVDARRRPAVVQRDGVGTTVEVEIGDVDCSGNVRARVRDGGVERTAAVLREHRHERARPVPSVGQDDVVPAVARDVADTDAGRQHVRPHPVLDGRAEAAAGELRQDAELRNGVQLPRHDHEVVAPVAGDVGDLEVLAASVLRRVLDRRREAAVTVVEQNAHGVFAPPHACNVQSIVVVQPAEPDLVGVGHLNDGRRAEQSGRQLREDLDPVAVERQDHVGPAVTCHVPDGHRLGQRAQVCGSRVRDGARECPARLPNEDEEAEVVRRVVVVPGRHHDVVAAVARDVADRDGVRKRADRNRLVGRELRPRRGQARAGGRRNASRRCIPREAHGEQRHEQRDADDPPTPHSVSTVAGCPRVSHARQL